MSPLHDEVLPRGDRADAPDGRERIKEPDPVNHPPHYTAHPSGVECIEIVERLGFCAGNMVKYVWRAGLKDGTTRLDDLKKALWYADRIRGSSVTPPATDSLLSYLVDKVRSHAGTDRLLSTVLRCVRERASGSVAWHRIDAAINAIGG
jgi:hypothetical protein